MSQSYQADRRKQQERELFERVAANAEANIMNAASHMLVDSTARQAYQRKIQAMSMELRGKALAGRIGWEEAANRANFARNAILETIRGRSTPVGRAIAQWLKREGLTLNGAVARYTAKLFGNTADFTKLTVDQRNQVFRAVVEAAGRDNPTITLWMRRLSRAGRGLLFVSLAISTYTIATSSDPAATAKREAAVTGAGIAGGIAAGALAGLACGPGAPVCVGIGAFVGGAAAAFGVDALW